MVKIIVAALAGMAGAALGWAAAAAITLALAYAQGVADRDGGLAMMAVFGIGPIGGVIGFIAGSLIALRASGVRSLGGLLARLPLVALPAALLIGGGAAWLSFTSPLTAPGALPPELLFEIRLPAGIAPPPLVSRADALARRSPIELRTPQNTMAAEIASVRTEAGRVVVVGRVEMAYRAAERILALRLPGTSAAVTFSIAVGRNPAASAHFGQWQPAKGNPGYEVRYRVARGGS